MCRTSASNCAQIYNDGLAAESRTSVTLPALFEYSHSTKLSPEDVWDGLFLYWLLEDAQERGVALELIHDAASQAKRLQPALHARNVRIAGPGQEAWSHACELCCWVRIENGIKGTSGFFI